MASVILKGRTAEACILRHSGSTALSLPRARLRNSFRSEHDSIGTSNSARRPPAADRTCSASAATRAAVQFATQAPPVLLTHWAREEGKGGKRVGPPARTIANGTRTATQLCQSSGHRPKGRKGEEWSLRTFGRPLGATCQTPRIRGMDELSIHLTYALAKATPPSYGFLQQDENSQYCLMFILASAKLRFQGLQARLQFHPRNR
jgi:hypothetical protein